LVFCALLIAVFSILLICEIAYGPCSPFRCSSRGAADQVTAPAAADERVIGCLERLMDAAEAPAAIRAKHPECEDVYAEYGPELTKTLEGGF
jgi:hypothetical protein